MSTLKTKPLLASIQLALAMMAAAPLVRAQDAPAADAAQAAKPKAADATKLQEIVVTAERRVENVQKVPVAIETLSGDALAQQGTVSVDAALRNVGSVDIRQSNKGGNVFIRGIGANLDPTAGDPAINLNIDGVYQLQSATVMTGMFDIDRIEVLKGPQGTLYGRNATAGSVNIVTNDPTSTFGGAASLQLGSYGTVRADAALNVPVSPAFALRVAAMSNKHKGYLADGYDNADTQAGRVKVLIKPGADLRIVVGADVQHSTGTMGDVLPRTGNAAAANNVPWVDGYPFNIATPPATKDIYPLAGSADNNLAILRAQLDWTTPIGTVTFIPSYTNFKMDLTGRFTGDYSTTHATDKTSTAELRLTSLHGSAAQWVAGLYYLDSDQTALVAFPSTSNQTSTPLVGARSQAAFGQITYPLTTQLSLTAGLRYTQDNKELNKITYAPNLVGGSTGLVTAALASNAANYKLGLQYQLAPSSMLYASTSTAYKAGGFTSVDTILPEKLKAFEFGSKNRFLGDSLELNLAAFYYQYRNFQTNAIGTFTYPSGQTVTTLRGYNATGLSPVRGLEVETVYKPTPNDKIRLGVTFLSAHFGTFVLPTGQNYTGFVLPQAPSRQGVYGYEHLWELADGGSVSATLQGRAVSSVWTVFKQSKGSAQSGYNMTDFYLRYLFPKGDWSITGYVKNLQNVAVMESFASGSLATATVAPPRTEGVIANYTF
ncbi:MAG: TonB-dependent receptor [Burkholderiales bacterium]|nr:TonB-dependent receptor [Burkholderiales bacterium]